MLWVIALMLLMFPSYSFASNLSTTCTQPSVLSQTTYQVEVGTVADNAALYVTVDDHHTPTIVTFYPDSDFSSFPSVLLSSDCSYSGAYDSIQPEIEFVNCTMRFVYTIAQDSARAAKYGTTLRLSVPENTMQAEIQTTIRVDVTSISVNVADGGESKLDKDRQSLSLQAVITPTDATNKEVEWVITEGADLVDWDASSHTLTAHTNGEAGYVTVEVRSTDGSGVVGSIRIRVDKIEPEPVEDITMQLQVIAGDGTGILQELEPNGVAYVRPVITPANYSATSIKYAIIAGADLIQMVGYKKDYGMQVEPIAGNRGGEAKIAATATINNGEYRDTVTIIVVSSFVPMSAINLTVDEGVDYLDDNLTAISIRPEVIPQNATSQQIAWSVVEGVNLIDTIQHPAQVLRIKLRGGVRSNQSVLIRAMDASLMTVVQSEMRIRIKPTALEDVKSEDGCRRMIVRNGVVLIEITTEDGVLLYNMTGQKVGEE